MAVAIVVAPLALSSCGNEDNWFGGGVIISGPGVVHQAATLEADSAAECYERCIDSWKGIRLDIERPRNSYRRPERIGKGNSRRRGYYHLLNNR